VALDIRIHRLLVQNKKPQEAVRITANKMETRRDTSDSSVHIHGFETHSLNCFLFSFLLRRDVHLLLIYTE
jgi:hypothetical protein